jgi:hypothetical protein
MPDPVDRACEASEAVEFLGRLRHDFPMDDFARMLMASRAGLWAWLDGTGSPELPDVQRMLEIRDLLTGHFGDDLRTAYRVWRSQARSGASLGSLFAASIIDHEAVAAQMELLRSSVANLKAGDERRRKHPFRTATGRNGAIDDLSVASFHRD